MRRKKGLLTKIDDARMGNWMHSLGGARPLDTLEEIIDPGLKQIYRFSDDELAEVVAREPTSKLGLLAARVEREREAWRTPAKWSLYIALASLAVAIIALVRTF